MKRTDRAKSVHIQLMRLATACKNPSEESFLGVTPSREKSGMRSPVISPSSMAERVARSSFFANAARGALPSSSPRFLRAPVHAKMVATELVDVSSPFKYL